MLNLKFGHLNGAHSFSPGCLGIAFDLELHLVARSGCVSQFIRHLWNGCMLFVKTTVKSSISLEFDFSESSTASSVLRSVS